MQQHLILGYSENVLSLLLEIFKLTGQQQPITILQNVETPKMNAAPFLPSGTETTIRLTDEPFELPAKYLAVFGVYTPAIKRAVYKYFLDKYNITEAGYTSLIHPSSVVASTAKLANGVHIEPLSVISPFAEVEFGVSVNRNVSIGHHTSIGKFSSVGPGTNIGGHTKIMENVQVGIGSVIFNDISIGSNSMIGGGSVVTSDIPENVIAWGNPCKVIRPVTTG